MTLGGQHGSKGWHVVRAEACPCGWRCPHQRAVQPIAADSTTVSLFQRPTAGDGFDTPSKLSGAVVLVHSLPVCAVGMLGVLPESLLMLMPNRPQAGGRCLIPDVPRQQQHRIAGGSDDAAPAPGAAEPGAVPEETPRSHAAALQVDSGRRPDLDIPIPSARDTKPCS